MVDETKMSNKMLNALEDIRNGKPIILVDEYHRENEGDIVIAAEKCDVENLVFTMNNAKGLMCLPCEGSILDNLELPPMVQDNTDPNETPFTVSIDALDGTTTGMSVYDRLKTISVLLDSKSEPKDSCKSLTSEGANRYQSSFLETLLKNKLGSQLAVFRS